MAANLDTEQFEALLQLLATDDEYRKLFVNHLPEALARLPGSPKPPVDPPEGVCLRPRTLASKEQLRESHEQLVARWLSKGAQIPHILEP